jgi:hypothetical protein
MTNRESPRFPCGKEVRGQLRADDAAALACALGAGAMNLYRVARLLGYDPHAVG